MAKKYSIFVMLHFQPFKQGSYTNEHVFGICMLLDSPEGQQKSRHQAIFSEPEPEGDLFLPPASRDKQQDKHLPCQKFSILLRASWIKYPQDRTSKTVLCHLHIFVMAKDGFRTIPLLSNGSLFQHLSFCTKEPRYDSLSALSFKIHTYLLSSTQ